MKKIMILVLSVFLLGACNANEAEQPQQIEQDEQPDIAQEEENTSITKEEAIEIVRDQVTGEPSIEYSHEYDGSFVIHTFEHDQNEFDIEYKKTIQWYHVERETGEIVQTTEYPRKVIGDTSEEVKSLAAKVIIAIAEKDMATVSQYIDHDRGLLFSPYLYVDESDLIFIHGEVVDFFEDENVYTWGVFDGKGNPIELTPSEYFDRFIYRGTYVEADEVVYDEEISRGNIINNLKEYFENSSIVEFYVEGTEQYSGMDWSSIRLVFDMSDTNDPKLIAIVNDEWTT